MSDNVDPGRETDSCCVSIHPEEGAFVSRHPDRGDCMGKDKSVQSLLSTADKSDDCSSEDFRQRATWDGRLEFLFTCISNAVGLGNIWRFPYLCYKNGGGAFLIPYFLMLAFVGFPLFFMELAFGQFASLGPITIWKVNPLFKGVGYAMVAVSWMVSVYYNVVISQVMLYLFASFKAIPTRLPWETCDNWWNTDLCIDHNHKTVNMSISGMFAGNMSTPGMVDVTTANDVNMTNEVLSKADTQSAAEEYYNNFVLEMSDGIEHANGINWKLALCLLLAWIIVLICLIRGISSLGKVVYVTAIFPYIMLTVLLIRGVTLPGAGQGLIYYLKPDFSRLLDAQVWLDAATQLFYTFGAGGGGLIVMSSYSKFNNNCLKDALIVAGINCGTSIYGGFAIFSILGFMAQAKGVDVGEVVQAGPGLVFIAYPEALSRMPASQLWAIFFFFMMATLAFGTQFAIVETVLSAFTDEFLSILKDKKLNVLFRTSVILFSFFMGLPMVTRGGMYLLNLVDISVSGFPLPVVCVLECICLAYFYGYDNFARDIELMLGNRPNIYWKITWKGFTPAILLGIILWNCKEYKAPVFGANYEYPAWALAMGWMITLFPILIIVSFFMWRFCQDGAFHLLREVGRPKVEWGPLLPSNRKGTIYKTTEAIEPAWRYDPKTQTVIFPETIQLSCNSAAPSVLNLNADITKVENYTGPIPVVIQIPTEHSSIGNPPHFKRARQNPALTDLALTENKSARGRTGSLHPQNVQWSVTASNSIPLNGAIPVINQLNGAILPGQSNGALFPGQSNSALFPGQSNSGIVFEINQSTSQRSEDTTL